MFDVFSIITDDVLAYTFAESSESTNVVVAYRQGEVVTTLTDTNGDITCDSEEVAACYRLWKSRPERKVGLPVSVKCRDMESLIHDYEELLVGAYIQSTKSAVDATILGRLSMALDWLRQTDFYTAPASSQWHESFPCGLLIHSLNVYNTMLELHDTDIFKSVDIAQAALVCLVHDWCKIGYYESYQKNVKNEATGQWEKVNAYKVNQKGIPLGHGVASLYIAMKLFKLTDEQALAIRWHMGAWSVVDSEKSELQNANKSYPMVYLAQFADQLACTEYLTKEA